MNDEVGELSSLSTNLAIAALLLIFTVTFLTILKDYKDTAVEMNAKSIQQENEQILLED